MLSEMDTAQDGLKCWTHQDKNNTNSLKSVQNISSIIQVGHNWLAHLLR